MPSNKIAIQTYITKELDDKLVAFCQENDGISKSKALYMIVETYLNKGVETMKETNTLNNNLESTLLEELNNLKNKVEILESKQVELDKVESTLTSKVNNEVDKVHSHISKLQNHIERIDRDRCLLIEKQMQKDTGIYGQIKDIWEFIEPMKKKIEDLKLLESKNDEDEGQRKLNKDHLGKRCQIIYENGKSKNFLSVTETAYILTNKDNLGGWLSKTIKKNVENKIEKPTLLERKLLGYGDLGLKPIIIEDDKGGIFKIKGFEFVENQDS